MSYNKFATTQRRHMDYVHIAKQAKIYKQYNLECSENLVLGKFRKKKAMNCGNAHCHLCTNPRKLWGHITIKEKSMNELFKEEQKESL